MEIRRHDLSVKNFEPDGSFSGYASVFNTVDLHTEQVAPGAFTKSLQRWRSQQQMPKMLWQHDPKTPIGIWQDIREDGYGLLVKGKLLLDIQQGREAYTLLKSGVVDGLSIGYDVIKAQRQDQRRILQEIELHEISLVTFAANPAARVTACKQAKVNPYNFGNLLKRLTSLEKIIYSEWAI